MPKNVSSMTSNNRFYRNKHTWVNNVVTLSLFGLCLCYSTTLYAQNLNKPNNRHKAGVMLGYGGQTFIEQPYHYKVYFIQLQYYYTLYKKKGWFIELVLQPQYNVTRYKPKNTSLIESNGHEWGLNMGLVIGKSFWGGRIAVYFLPSIGPHYTIGTPERQANGFIFSDNLFIGIRIKVDANVYIDIRPGFRHISNANLEQPNGGVNTSIINGGAYITIP